MWDYIILAQIKWKITSAHTVAGIGSRLTSGAQAWPREFIQELRGDVRREAIDIYDHIDKKELRESYLAHIPQLGI